MSASGVQLDHVLVAVSDLEQAGSLFQTAHGLGSVEGGWHPGRGTANRIVPLGDSYVELIAVVDRVEAERSAFGRWVGSGASPAGTPIGWAVRTQHLDTVAHRLGLDVGSGSRRTPDGRLLSWRSAGGDSAAREPLLPFFIEWGEGVPHPARTPVAHAAGPAAISRLVLQGDRGRLASWLGNGSLPVEVEDGPPRVLRLVIGTARGEVVLQA